MAGKPSPQADNLRDLVPKFQWGEDEKAFGVELEKVATAPSGPIKLDPSDKS